jgi:hypothetical protein
VKTLTTTTALVALLLGACAPGASEAEFVAACMANNAAEFATEEICRCGAREARDKLSPKHYQAVVLHMQRKKREAEELLGDLSFEERATFAMAQFEILGACVSEK